MPPMPAVEGKGLPLEFRIPNMNINQNTWTYIEIYKEYVKYKVGEVFPAAQADFCKAAVLNKVGEVFAAAATFQKRSQEHFTDFITGQWIMHFNVFLLTLVFRNVNISLVFILYSPRGFKQKSANTMKKMRAIWKVGVLVWNRPNLKKWGFSLKFITRQL